MALQNYMNDLMEESGAETIIVIPDDVTNHSLEKHASLKRSEQQGNAQVGPRDSKLSLASADALSPTQLRRDSSGSIQPSLVSMNNSPLRGQFCLKKRVKGQLLEQMNPLPIADQLLPRSRSPLRRKPCIYEPRNDN